MAARKLPHAGLYAGSFAFMLGCAPSAKATPVTYEFVDATASFGSSAAAQQTITGTFTFDSSTNTLISADVTLSAGLQGDATTFTIPFSDSYNPFDHALSLESTTSVWQLLMSFQGPLLSNASDPLSNFALCDGNCAYYGKGSYDAGAADAVPEPGTLALLGGSLGLLGLRRRASSTTK